MLIIHAILYLVLCLTLCSSSSSRWVARALLLRWIGYYVSIMTAIISLMLLVGVIVLLLLLIILSSSIISIRYILRLRRISLLLIIIGIGILLILYHIHDVYIVFRSSICLLVMIIIRMSCICIKVANILSLTVQLIAMIELSIIINDLDFLL